MLLIGQGKVCYDGPEYQWAFTILNNPDFPIKCPLALAKPSCYSWVMALDASTAIGSS